METGAPSSDLPDRFGFWKMVCKRFRRSRSDGLLDRTVAKLQREFVRDGLSY